MKKNEPKVERASLKEILSTKNSISGIILLIAGIILTVVSYARKWSMIVSILGIVICSAGTQTIMNEIRDKS